MIHVLIIEDEPAIARGLSLLITKNYPDFQISGICKNGRDGLQKILELKPELVFTDITMPVMNGLDMIEEVQRNHLHTRFVILTGYADFEYARKAIHLGVSDYLLKPIDLKTLDDILLSCLEQQKSETRLLQKEYLQFQLTADLRYYISAVIQNCHRDIVYPDVAEIVSTCYSYEELERELQYETDKICGFHSKTPGEELPSLARQVRNYLDRNFTQQITTKSFQDIFGYNEKYISTLFKSEFGISPSKYISELRLKMAKTLMQNNPDILTKDVAEMVGFSDAFYFSRVFKSHEGMSPSQFLKNLRKD